MGAVAKITPREQLKQELARYVPSYEKLLPKGYDGARMVTGALLAATKNPELLKCTPQSVAVAVAQVAQWGLDIGTTAHLVPFGRECTAIIDYKGYVQLITGAGARKVEAHVVREGDEFEWRLGTDPYLRHVPRSSAGKIVAAYAVVWLRGGVYQFEVMSAEEIDAIRQAKSKSWKNGPLTKWYARKTCIRQLAKYVEKSPRLAAALAGETDELEPVEPSPELLARVEPERPRPVPIMRTGGYDGDVEDDEPETFNPDTGEVLGDAAE